MDKKNLSEGFGLVGADGAKWRSTPDLLQPNGMFDELMFGKSFFGFGIDLVLGFRG